MPNSQFTITITSHVEIDPAPFAALLIEHGPPVGVWGNLDPTAEEQLNAEVEALEIAAEWGPAKQLEWLLAEKAKAAMKVFADELRTLFPGTTLMVAPLSVTPEGSRGTAQDDREA